ncbi:MAG: class I SAM-dependent methyltransferase [Pseudomonadota bacterium]|nr:class I SAM-dependent methyltransferase [Pseudomonadota bacterium]
MTHPDVPSTKDTLPIQNDVPLLALPCAGSAWMEPACLSSPAPWAGHIPFAAWLMAATRPRTLVELGVYSGISYLAFCQAAVAHGVPLRAWGVDTWQGDEHAGHYGQRILDTLRAQHDAPYGAFSTLLQKTFDQALADIPDGSVDLLHIDGLHTYEAVRHDFETWQCKLSARAVVLFHDIEVRQGDFGVWRYWAEITRHYPSLAFAHSNGLGVLLAGPQAPAILQTLARDTRRWPAVRDAFAALGERFELRAQRMHLDTVVADLQQKERAQHDWIAQQDARLREAEQVQAVDRTSIQALQQELAQRDGQLQASQAALTELQHKEHAQHDWIAQQDARLREAEQVQAADRASIQALQQELAQRDEQWQASQAALMARDAELVRRDSEQKAEMLAWQQRMSEVTRQARRATQELQAERAQNRALRTEVQDMLASRSWRITASLRWLGRQARRLRATPAGQALITQARRARKALGYVMAGDWRALAQRMRHVKQQATEVQRLQQFDGQSAQSVRCGILATPHTAYVAHALLAALARAGMPAQIVAESDSGDWPLDLYFVVCPQMFKRLPPGEKRVAFQMEQTVSSRWFTPDYLGVLENSLAALDYAHTNIANLADYGIVYPHVYLLPIGGMAGYAQWLSSTLGQPPAEADETCDVLFYGDANAPRRRRLLAAIGQRFKLRVVGNAFGADMHRALAGAKVVVNLHYYEGALLETTRIYECLSLGKAVVSETAADQAEHACLDGVVRFAPVDDVPALLEALAQAVQEQSTEAGRTAWAQRCQAAVAATQARFDFMLYRMLLARRVMDYPLFEQLTAAGQPLAPRVALSLPETTTRRQAFEEVRPPDVQVFDGLRYAPGWVGCALSYKHLAQSALRQGLPQIEIMEDDVAFPPTYVQRHERVQAYLSSRAGQWDVFVGVMALVHPDTRVLNVEQVDGETYVTIDRMISMVCNTYAPEALRRIAQWNETEQNAETNTIDRFLQSQGGLRVVVALPFLVEHRDDMHSSLWGIANTRYTQLIENAQLRLGELAEAFVQESQASH